SVSRHVPYFSKKFRLASQSFLLSLLLAAAQLNGPEQISEIAELQTQDKSAAAADNFGCLVRCMECFRFDECLRPDAPNLSETTLRRCSLAALLLATLPDPMRPLAKHLRFVEELRRCPYMSRKCSIKLAHIVSGIAAAKTIDPDSNGRIDDNTLTARQFCTRHADAIIDLIGARLDAA
uniref:Saposin B-type domain-containing protein n=1 Tax=Macrostomum lignano TaxID=282301 RepID=A0A1I8IET3_9PLAT